MTAQNPTPTTHSSRDVAFATVVNGDESECLQGNECAASRHRPTRTIADFRNLDEGEVLEGYLDGVHGDPYPASGRSRSYRHGWRNGMVERGSLRPDDAMRALRRDFERLR